MLLKNILSYLSSSLIGQVLIGIQQFIIRYIFPPSIMGIWNFVGVIQGFVATFDIGLDKATLRKLPLISSQGNTSLETHIRSATFWGKLLQVLLLSLGVLGYMLWHYEQLSFNNKVSFLTAIVLVVTSGIIQTFVTFLQGHQYYVSLSKVQLTFSVCSATLLPLAAYFGTIYTFLIAVVLINVILILFYIATFLRLKLPFTQSFNKQTLIELIKVGLPLRLVDYPQSLLLAIDGILITTWLGLTPLVIYVTTKNIFKLLSEIPTRIGTVIITRCFSLHGKHENYTQIGQELYLFLLTNYLILSPLICISAHAAFSLLIVTLLPKYAEAITLFIPLFPAIFFIPQTSLLQNLLQIENRTIHIGISNVIMLAAFLISMLLLNLSGQLTLVSTAKSLTFSFFIYHIFMLLTFGRTVLGTQRSLGLLCLSIGSACISAFSMSLITIDMATTLSIQSLLFTGYQWAKALLVILPMLLLGSVGLYRHFLRR